MIPVFITGTGTGIGKTIVSVMVSQALESNYWKPVQSGNIDGTDSSLVRGLIPAHLKCLPEVYNLAVPASPHIAARNENLVIDLDLISNRFKELSRDPSATKYLVIEGAGGLMVPLNNREFILDLILRLKARVLLVSRNYLGSINHSLLTAQVCKQNGIEVLGWIFNDEYMQYQDEIAAWSGFPVIGSIPRLDRIDQETLLGCSLLLREQLLQSLERSIR